MVIPPSLTTIQSFLRVLLDVLIPPRCLRCGALTDAPGSLCAACWTAITFLSAPHCACCGLPFELDTGAGSLCGGCTARPPRYDRARSVFLYDDASRSLLLRFKHGDRTGGAAAFARWMARAGGELLAEADLLVPVPLHPWRLFRRRYNQSALLALDLTRLTGVASLPDALTRVRNTPVQGHMNREQRRRNVRGAFRLRRPDAVRGRRVVLIDDVMTTGATLEECARVLRMGGAATVDVLTLARVVI